MNNAVREYSQQNAAEDTRKLAVKKYVSLSEGCELYSIGLSTFRKLADDAGAVYKVGKLVLINTELFEKYLESFRVWR